jgi:hypothetical protein
MKLEFAPGCFDSFEGTQEELEELIAEITAMFESGELEENAELIDIDELREEDPEMAEKVLLGFLEESGDVKRNLQ